MLYTFENKAKILSGEKALESIPFELMSRRVSNPLIISEDIIEKVGFVKKVKKAFDVGNISIKAIYSKVPEIAEITRIEKLYELYKKEGCDSIIAIGRNSVLATAKALKYMINTETAKIADIAPVAERHEKTVLIVVPVYLGTSEEAIDEANVYDLQSAKAYQLKSALIQPDAVVIDKRMIDTLPPKLVVSASLYALSIALVAHNAQDTNCVTQVYASTAIKLIADNLENVIKKGVKKSRLVPLVEAMVYAGIAKSQIKINSLDVLSRTISRIKKLPIEKIYTSLFVNSISEFLQKRNYVGGLLINFVGLDKYIEEKEDERYERLCNTIRDFSNNVNRIAQSSLSLSSVGVERDDFSKIIEKAKFDYDANKLDEAIEINKMREILNKAI